ncbi:hypothetical protein C475_14683 [Halosimplex carlsbadense 2-9-1]|uniref:Uncharacterized protein n=1 Tax=Halosimplex carlsbadense 2-9-1 TaxID=797114 RepID=M0CLP3_9EURY|nr:hypothetical protein [Halosimplex carlsbadense]ELZ23528.1 hypothetical protein C475_14683 [Halosimplex carlsbadense 2-9-1]
MTGRFALDIETVSPSLDRYERPPDFRDPAHFELLAVGLAYEDADGEREAEMLYRETGSPEGELDLVDRTCDWIDDRPGDVCLTYGGERFDFVHLVGRAEAAASERPERAATYQRISSLLDEGLTHDDIQPSAQAEFGEYTSLEAACAEVGIEPAETRWADYEHGIDLDELRPPKYRGLAEVTNKDIPVLGERYLALADAGATETLTFRSLRELLDHYGREDIVHLFDLADERPFGG